MQEPGGAQSGLIWPVAPVFSERFLASVTEFAIAAGGAATPAAPFFGLIRF